MKNNILISIILFAFKVVALAQLSPSTNVYLVTLGPGNELYSGFGHSAIWFQDSTSGLDRAYNYGTFDFKPDFYIKFTKGILDYKLSVHSFYYLEQDAKEEQRYLINQKLNLSDSQKQNLFLFLENNLKPENQYYRYDFFYDNCSSRIRDVLKTVCADSLEYKLSQDKDLSFRQLIDLYLHDKRFQDFGMDLGLGSPADKKATPFQYMFLPEFLKSAFDSAQVLTAQGWQPLVSRQQIIFQPTAIKDKEPSNYTLWLCWALCVAVVVYTYLFINKAYSGYLFDFIWHLATGLLGCLLVFLWFFTDHNTTQYNFDLLWALPPNLGFAFYLLKKRNSPLLKVYIIISFLSTLTLLFGWKYLPEEMNTAVFPLVLISLWRMMKIMFDRFDFFPKSKS